MWNDPANEELKKLRPDPNLLAPGDILRVPEKKPDEDLSIAKGVENNYNAKGARGRGVTLVFQDDDGKPIAGEDYEILGLTDEASASAQGQDEGRRPRHPERSP